MGHRLPTFSLTKEQQSLVFELNDRQRKAGAIKLLKRKVKGA